MLYKILAMKESIDTKPAKKQVTLFRLLHSIEIDVNTFIKRLFDFLNSLPSKKSKRRKGVRELQSFLDSLKVSIQVAFEVMKGHSNKEIAQIYETIVTSTNLLDEFLKSLNGTHLNRRDLFKIFKQIRIRNSTAYKQLYLMLYKASASSSRDRFQGCLLGAAIGDALGMPVEFMTAEQVVEKYGKVDQFYPKPNKRLQAGQWTDDTQQTLILLDSFLLYKGAVIMHEIRRRLTIWANNDSSNRGMGSTTRIALKSDVLSTRNHPTNGAAMRTAPIALLCFEDLEKLRQASTLIANITHIHPASVEASRVVSFIIALAVSGNLDPETLLDEIKPFIKNPEIKKTITFTEELLNEDSYTFPEKVKLMGNSGLATETLGTALLAFLTWPDDFKEALTQAVSQGGDADTIGTIVGAISGAYNGLSKIPNKWREEVESGNDIITKAGLLFNIASSRE